MARTYSKKGNAKVINKANTSRLYIKLIYFGRYIVKSTGLKDTPENRMKVEEVANRMTHDIKYGYFKFSNAFPGASDEELRFFTEKEGGSYYKNPENITFSDLLTEWKIEVYSKIDSTTKRIDYKKAINPRIKPFFGELTLTEITPQKIEEFIQTLTQVKDGKIVPLSEKRIKNIFIPLNKILRYGFSKYGLEKRLADFYHTNDKIINFSKPKKIEIKTKSDGFEHRLTELDTDLSEPLRRGIIFSDYSKILAHIDPFYRPACELALLTGMISSEIAALRPFDIKGDFIHIQTSFSRGIVSNRGKTTYRNRKIPITRAIARVLNDAQKQGNVPFIFMSKTGKNFSENTFRKNFVRACRKAGINRYTPYDTRHSFVLYSRILGINDDRLVHLMGHADRSMINRTYGKYKQRAEREYDDIREYMGQDYLLGPDNEDKVIFFSQKRHTRVSIPQTARCD